MYGLYPVLLLQAFCVYHAYRNDAQQRWYWIIVLFPLIGCILYFFHNFNNRASIDAFRENIKEAVVSNYRIEQLEKALELTDSITNKENLADAYMEVGRYKDAIPLYESCLQGFMADDPPLRMKLLYAYFMDDNFKEAIRLGQELESEKTFRVAEQRLAYAWALYHDGRIENAERVFSEMDHSFTNYVHRLEYSKFLLKINKQDLAKEKLAELLSEFDKMQDSERRQKRPIQRDIKAILENLAHPA